MSQKDRILEDGPLEAYFFDGQTTSALGTGRDLSQVIPDPAGNGRITYETVDNTDGDTGTNGPPGFDQFLQIRQATDGSSSDPDVDDFGLEYVGNPGLDGLQQDGPFSVASWWRQPSVSWQNSGTATWGQVWGFNDRIGWGRESSEVHSARYLVRDTSGNDIGNITSEGAGGSGVSGRPWVHEVTVYDGSEWRLYRNGELIASQSGSGTPHHNIDSLTFGFQYDAAEGGSRRRGATIDIASWAYYDYALTPQQIENQFLGVDAGPDPINRILSDNPVAFWPLESDGSSLVAGTPDLTEVTSGRLFWHTDDPINPAPGYGGYLELDNSVAPPAGMEWTDPNNGLPVFNTQFTWECWAWRPSEFGDVESGAWNQIIGGNDRIGIRRDTSSNNALNFPLRTASNDTITNISTSGDIPNSEWLHLAITYDGQESRFYLNGALYSTQAGTGTPATDIRSFTVGFQYDDPTDLSTPRRGFSGFICGVAIFDYALTAQQIEDHYLGTPLGSESPYPAPAQPLVFLGGSPPENFRWGGQKVLRLLHAGRQVWPPSEGAVLLEEWDENGRLYYTEEGSLNNDAFGVPVLGDWRGELDGLVPEGVEQSNLDGDDNDLLIDFSGDALSVVDEWEAVKVGGVLFSVEGATYNSDFDVTRVTVRGPQSALEENEWVAMEVERL